MAAPDPPLPRDTDMPTAENHREIRARAAPEALGEGARRGGRGRVKIVLGAGPGVGKAWAGDTLDQDNLAVDVLAREVRLLPGAEIDDFARKAAGG